MSPESDNTVAAVVHRSQTEADRNVEEVTPSVEVVKVMPEGQPGSASSSTVTVTPDGDVNDAPQTFEFPSEGAKDDDDSSKTLTNTDKTPADRTSKGSSVTSGASSCDHTESAESSKDSIEVSGNLTPASVGSKADSGIDIQVPVITTPKEKEHPQLMKKRSSGKGSAPPLLLPKQLSGSEARKNDSDSDSSESYYEEIEIKAPDALSCTSTYLDPSAYARALENNLGRPKDSTLGHHQNVLRELEMLGKMMLSTGELVVSEIEESCIGIPMDDISPEERDNYADFIGTTLIFDKCGNCYYIPTRNLRKHGDPSGEPWFYPVTISSRQATLFLSEINQEGSFVVYKPTSSVTSGAIYNLSVCRANGDVIHYHIVENVHGDVMVENHDHSFMNVRDLVQYFQRNKSKLACRLRRPLKEAQMPITPGYHYDMRWEINRPQLQVW